MYPQINTTNCSDIIKLVNALLMETSGYLLLFAEKNIKHIRGKTECNYRLRKGIELT